MSNVIHYKEVFKRKIDEYYELLNTSPESSKIGILLRQYIKLRDWERFERTGRWG